MKFKKCIYILLIAAMSLTLFACGRGKKEEEPSEPSAQGYTSGEALYDHYDKLLKQLEPMAASVTSAYSADTGKEIQVSYSAFSNACIDVYSFTEGMTVEFAEDVLDSFYEDLRLEETGKNEYTLTYTGTDLITEEKFKGAEVIRFDPEELRMSCVFYRNDEYYSFSEFACVSEDTYVGIMPQYRLLIKCEGDTVKEFWYEENKDDNLNDLDDSVYYRTGLDENWIREDEAEGGIYRLSCCDGTTLTITGSYKNVDPETGEISYMPGFKWSYSISE